MPIASQTMIDPLHAFMAGAFVAGTPRPCPLVSTRFDVTIDAGLAIVVMTRTFRNGEADSIEATITFPLPVHATLFALEARIGERVLAARAARKNAARRAYEDAVDRGKGAVLHEEVLRGVHMLSVGQIAPGSEVEVRATWANTLTHLNGRGRLRIPLTVGDIYGRSGLAESDELIHGGPVQCGVLTVTCRDGVVSLIGGRLEDGRADIALNAPIDLDVTGWTPRTLAGRMADGRPVALRIEPLAGGEQTLDVWEFAAKLKHIGSSREASLHELVGRLDGPDGGTEIGHAVTGVLAATGARDILLVTDGKSHALDVQALARSGRRFALVLVGADSLEAHVGHLAALSGGEIFVSAGPDLPAMLGAAVRSLRMPHRAPQLDRREMRERRAGMELVATWNEAGVTAKDQRSIESRAAAAIAAKLMLPTLEADVAAELAQTEGLVTHLTSLVLVDEAGAVQETVPAARKVALPSPAGHFSMGRGTRMLRNYHDVVNAPVPEPLKQLIRGLDSTVDGGPKQAAPPPSDAGRRQAEARRSREEEDLRRSAVEARRSAEEERRVRSVSAARPAEPSSGRWLPRLTRLLAPSPPSSIMAALAARIDWDAAPQRLQAGDLAGLDGSLADAIRRIAAEPWVIKDARDAGCDPVVLVIALLAKAVAHSNRTADRIARAILG